MSEYQYYEFQAIDQPLDQQAQQALRQITSRADITSRHLINEYQWGDFKGDPARLMEQYFDAHLYFANWGTHRLMLRVPRITFDVADAQPYQAENVLDVWQTNDHVIFSFQAYDEPEWEEYDYDLDELILLRDDLMVGDFRCLYLAWLSGVGGDFLPEDAAEPPIPPGLGNLSETLKHLADFLYLDPALLETVAKGSETLVPAMPTDEGLMQWAVDLPVAEKDEILTRAILRQVPQVRGELLRRYRGSQQSEQSPTPASSGRTAEELYDLWHDRAAELRRIENEQRAREQAERQRREAEKRANYISSLRGNEEKHWSRIEELIQTKQQKNYGEAVRFLRDLQEAAKSEKEKQTFRTNLASLRDRHSRKSTLMQRMEQAGFLR